MPKSITLEGRKYTPKWDWSPDYARYVRAQLKVPSQSAEAIAEKYARWLAERDGIDIGQPMRTEGEGFRTTIAKADCIAIAEYEHYAPSPDSGRYEKFVKAVRFHKRTYGGYRGYGARETVGEEVARIEIPNADPRLAHAWTSHTYAEDAKDDVQLAWPVAA